MKIRLNERILARELRKRGLSFSEIMARISNLSKGTLNGWLKDIELTQKQKQRLLSKIKDGANKGRLKGAFTNHQKRIKTTRYFISLAKNEVQQKIINPLFVMGVMLYWAEGDKTRERVALTNSDPTMIQFMMKWFREICKVPEAKFRIALSIMTIHDKKESEAFWSQITEVPITKFHRTRIKQTSLRGKRNPSYMGTCKIIISDKNLFRKIVGWKLGILENLKINAPIAQRIEQMISNH